MKNRKRLLFLVLLLVLAVAGCSREQEQENGYKVYYVNTEGTHLVDVSYTPQAETFEEMMEELLGALAQAPAGYLSALPENVTINGYERGIDALRIDFSEEYYELSNTDEVLLRAAVVKTVSQIPGVVKIMITVGGEQLQGADEQPVPAMDADTFIDTKEGGINSYLYAKLTLYFANEDGERLIREERNLHYSSNMVLERVVLEELIRGPEHSGEKALFTDDVKIESVNIQNGICTIGFDGEANRAPSDNPPDAETVLYAVVNSICETCDDITGVKFEIDGESDGTFRDTVELDQVFMADTSYIETNQLETGA